MVDLLAGDRRTRRSLRRVKFVHYYTTPLDDVPDGTPAPVLLATLRPVTSTERAFALHLVAERHGIPAADVSARRHELEREMLEDFYELVRSATDWRWLHWNMDSILYGFPAL